MLFTFLLIKKKQILPQSPEPNAGSATLDFKFFLQFEHVLQKPDQTIRVHVAFIKKQKRAKKRVHVFQAKMLFS